MADNKAVLGIKLIVSTEVIVSLEMALARE